MTPCTLMFKYLNYLKSKKNPLNDAKKLSGKDYTYKTTKPSYSIKSLDININTRNTKIYFEETYYYRTVERYVQRNYVRTPIYSDWKLKVKEFTIHEKLTNQVLEDLKHNSNEFISCFSSEIVCLLNNEYLMPLWFCKELSAFYLWDYENCLINENKLFTEKSINEINNIKVVNNEIETNIKNLTKVIKKESSKIKKYNNKIEKIDSFKKNIFKTIFTFGIIDLLNSQKRSLKIKDKLNLYNKKYKEFNALKDNYNNDLNTNIKSIVNLQNENKKFLSNNSEKYEKEKNKINNIVSKLTPLKTTVYNDEAFLPLFEIFGCENEDFKGVYIIRNTKKDIYYVGQSKNVLKRLNQHFNKDCSPKNYIFAEDYYTTPEEERHNLFTAKIIKCESKDELDSTEKHYIEYYDSFNNGYNKTAGND